MTFSDYWSAKTAKHSALVNSDNRMSMTVGEFCRQLRLAYEAGEGHTEPLPKLDKSSTEDGAEMFERLFGKGFNNKDK